MGDKKRKVVEDPTEEPIAPEGKKLKKDKKEKKEKKEKAAKDVVDTTPAETAPVSDEPKERNDSNYKKYKEAMKEKRAEKKEKKREKREKKDKKYKPKDQGEGEAQAGDENGEKPLYFVDTEGEKREKKERKDKKYNNKKGKKAAAAAAAEEKEEAPAAPQENEDEPMNGEELVSAETEEVSKEKNARFICFVGNLPYSANTESVKKHFEKNPPASVRVATKKDQPNKCRGFAFIEFDNYDRMKTALKLYHHSNFDDGKYPARRINVELTAGGGGANSEHRKAKIQAKNEKLNDERQRGAKQIQKDKKKHDKKKGAQGNGGTGANAVGVEGADGDDQFAGLHPSRRGRLQ